MSRSLCVCNIKFANKFQEKLLINKTRTLVSQAINNLTVTGNSRAKIRSMNTGIITMLVKSTARTLNACTNYCSTRRTP